MRSTCYSLPTRLSRAELDLLIRGGEVVDGLHIRTPADVAVRDGRVVEVSEHVDGSASRVLDADGLLVTPGFVDVTPTTTPSSTGSHRVPASWHGVTRC